MSGKRTCLVLAPRFPLPKRSGTQIREYHALVELASRFDITLVSLIQDSTAFDYISEVESLGVTVEPVSHERSRRDALGHFCTSTDSYRVCRFVTPALRRRTHRVLREQSFNLVWVNFATTVPALPPSVSAPVVVDEHNEDVRYWESFLDGGVGTRLFARANIWKLRRLRRTLTERVDGFLAVSDNDAERTRRWSRGIPVWTVPNGVDVQKFDSDKRAGAIDDTIQFVGSLDVRMNTDALSWFVENAWPFVREQRPNAVFQIIGRNPTPSVEKLGTVGGVRVHGEVDRVVPWYESAALTVAPFRFGGGSKLKVLESLSMRRPVVSTPVGTVGLDVSDNAGVLVRDDPETFADAVVGLLADSTKRTRLGDAGRQFVTERYAWEEIMAEGIDTIESALLE
ncbi:glycosyltransferase family 4 protein [Halorussus amylolyticus]|uniref:glycosyltransferase family 4 protein n=1 Tax=Halorussus amylolyticus TaxID=1126242 RepID=UPI00104F1BE0|nr:glycosyltransferase family 4 protein [Halorussus amylolyticus]